MSTPNKYSLEQLAGQRLMLGFDGTTLNADLKKLIETLKVGGLILFARNVETPEQLRQLCTNIQAYATDCGQPPLFIAIDQEGGQVARLKAPFTEFSAMPPLGDTPAAARFARITARELTAVGINMNMAPVMDVIDRSINSIMAKRAFSHDPNIVARIGTTVITGLQIGGVMAVAKHFPGIGRTTLDSHLALPFLNAAIEQLQTDLIPFEAAIASGVTGIMLSHIQYRALDPDLPASLSVKIARDLLRDQMGYPGLIITDDLDMGAIRQHYDIETAMDHILAAGVDLALICHQGSVQARAFKRICQWLADSPANQQAGQESVQRLLRYKQRFIENPVGQFED